LVPAYIVAITNGIADHNNIIPNISREDVLIFLQPNDHHY
jgi:hypothetical protein